MAAGALGLVPLAIWDWPVWRAFLDSLPLTRHVVIEQGITGWKQIASAFAFVRMWGGLVPLASARPRRLPAAPPPAISVP